MFVTAGVGCNSRGVVIVVYC